MLHPVRHSHACPLAVDWLDLPETRDVAALPGRLGLVWTAPDQGWQHGARAWWLRDPGLDLQRLASVYGCKLLICVLDAKEAVQLAEAGVEETAKALGMAVQRVTVDGADLPLDHEAVRCLQAMGEARQRGEAVVVLATGPGRAELLATASFVNLGMLTRDALAVVARVRPNVARSPAQLAFLSRQVPVAATTERAAAMTVYYHRHCPDGATAAWVAKMWCEQQGVPVQLVPLGPNETPFLALAAGTQVLMLDVCAPAEALDALHATAATLTVLDHHKTSAGLAQGRPWVHIDQEACGAMLAWRWFYGDAPPPPIIAYVQDMDLWRNLLPGTHAIQRLLRSMLAPEKVAAVADALAHDLAGTIERLGAVLETDRAMIRQYLGSAAAGRLGEMPVHAVFLHPRHSGLASDIGNAVAEKFGGVAVIWRREGGTYRYSLRSVPKVGPDVTELAQLYGGGGHTHAAGCKAARQLLQFDLVAAAS